MASSEAFSLRVLAGTANVPLAEAVAKSLGLTLEPRKIARFADGEFNIHIEQNVRGADVFLIQPVCPPHVNDALVELLLLMHTLRLASAARITAVVPYLGYSRQDRKTKPRVPISASFVAQQIESLGVHRLLTVDLHSGQICGFFHRIPVDNLFAEPLFVNHIGDCRGVKEPVVVVSPDAGGVERARRLADRIGARGVVTILKRRVEANQVESMQVMGDVDGAVCLIVDDMIDTGTTLCKAADLLCAQGGRHVHAYASHGVFSGEALEKIDKCTSLNTVYVTDSIPQEANRARCKKLVVLGLAPLLSQAVSRLHYDQSLSSLFGSACTLSHT